MSLWFRLVCGACAVGFAVALSGCTPSGRSQLSEEKEPHFVLGKSRVNAMDFQGAIEAFEQSLEANPHSATAHFELGWLYDEKTSDPAAAIYHYQEYLKLNPNADNADVIKQRIYRCKQQLAADVLPLPSAPAAQQQLEKLSEQNRQLQDEVGKWRAYYASQLAAAKTNSTPTPGYRDTTANRKSNTGSTGANYFHHASRCEHGPFRKSEANRRRAAHAHGRHGRNGDGHHTQIRRETQCIAGGESGREPKPDSHRPGPEPSVTVIDPHDSASHLSFDCGILGRDEHPVMALGIWFARQWHSRAGGFGVAEGFDRAGHLVTHGLSRRAKSRLLRIFHQRRTSHGRAR